MTVFSFHPSVLLWCITTRFLVENALDREELLTLMRVEFKGVITSKAFDRRFELVYGVVAKCLKCVKRVRLVCQKIDPSITTKVIN